MPFVTDPLRGVAEEKGNKLLHYLQAVAFEQPRYELAVPAMLDLVGPPTEFPGELLGKKMNAGVRLRVDLRYFRAVSAGSSVFDFDFENLDFIRFTAGLALRF